MTRGRILQTGITTQHCGRGTQLKYDPVAKLFSRALEHYGYEVEHRVTTPDEDLTGFDAIFVGLGPVNGLGARYTYGGLDAIARARQSGAALVLYIDDWQTHLIQTSCRTMLKDPGRIAKDFLRGARDVPQWEWVRADTEHRDRLLGACDALVNRTWPATVMALYDGGDWSLFGDRVNTRKLVGVDGTPFYTDYDITIPQDDEKWAAWVFGVLSNQTDWIDKLNHRWPIVHRGAKASKAEVKLPESELVQLYANAWGVLSCPYWHAGSGWLRIRHHHAAQVGSILVSESPELAFISDAYSVKIGDVEGMSIPDLRELANAQSTAWFNRLPSKDEVATRIGELFDDEIASMKS